MSWFTLRRLVWVLVGALILFTVVGALVGGWARIWLPNYAAASAGLLVTVLVVERVVEAESERRRRLEETPLRHSAQRRLRLVLASLFATLIHVYVGPDVEAPLPQPITNPLQFLEALNTRLRQMREASGSWVGTWILDPEHAAQTVGDVERDAQTLQEVADRVWHVMTPAQLSVLDDFIMWSATAARLSPSQIATLDLQPGDPLSETVDEALTGYFAGLSEHSRALVTLHDELGDELFSLEDVWNSVTAEIKLIQAIFGVGQFAAGGDEPGAGDLDV